MVSIATPSSTCNTTTKLRQRIVVSTKQRSFACWSNLSFAALCVVVLLSTLAWSGVINDTLGHSMGSKTIVSHTSTPPVTALHDPSSPHYTVQQLQEEGVEDEDESTNLVWSKETKAYQNRQQEVGEEQEEEYDDYDEQGYGGRDMPPLQEHFPGKKKAKPYDPLTEDPIDKCRRDPTWRRSVDYNECKKLTKWEPRDTWWRLDTGRNDFVLNGHVNDIHKCIAKRFDVAKKRNQFPWTKCNEEDRDASCQVPPTEVSGYYKNNREGEAVMFDNAMTEQEVFGLQALQCCMRKFLPQENPWWEYREFGFDPENDVPGGNEVTFVHGMIQLFVPGIAATLYHNFRMAYKQGNWAKEGFLNLGYPSPNSLGIRTAEALEYRDSGRLGTHTDSESVFTIAIALSEEDSYQGGHFRLESEHALFKVPRLGALSFFAESFHGVSKVTGGDRSIFVVELWESDDAPPAVPRCSPRAWFEHMIHRWPVISGAAKEYLSKDGKKESSYTYWS